MSADALAPLVEQARAGDPAALTELCRALQGPLYRLARRMLWRAAEAEDATQEILVKVVTHLSEFEGRSAVLSWAYTIAVRHLLRAQAGRAEASALSMEQLAESLDLGMQAEPVQLSEGEARVLEQEVRLSCTHGMLLSLTREERLAVILADVLGLDSLAGAAVCEVTPEAFRQRLARGRARLRPVLEERCGLVDPRNPCRCAGQIPAKLGLGMRKDRLAFSPLAPPETDEGARVRRAAAELHGLQRAARAFHVDPPLEPPKALLERLRAACPELLK